MAVPLIQSLAKEVSMNTIKLLLTDINCLSGVHQVIHMLIGKGLRMAATALASVLSTTAAAAAGTVPAAIMGSLPAFVSKKSKQSQSTAFRRLRGFAFLI